MSDASLVQGHRSVETDTIFDYVKVETAGQGTPGASEADLIGIVDPLDFRDEVLRQRDSLSAVPVLPPGVDEGADGTIELLTEIRDLLSRIAEKQ